MAKTKETKGTKVKSLKSVSINTSNNYKNALNRSRYNQLVSELNKNAYIKWQNELKAGTYKSYMNTKCNSFDDLKIIAGMAYSWMPTMLSFYGNNVDEKKLMKLIASFKQNDLDCRIELATELSKIINNSIVGTSKVLHIINPDFAPMIDSRVVRKWNSFFKKKYNINLLPKSLAINDKNRTSIVSAYIQYWDYLLNWKSNLKNDVSIRDIEVLFYFLGGRNKKKKFS